MSDLTQLAQRIFRETVAAIDIPATMRRKIRRDVSRLSVRIPGDNTTMDVDDATVNAFAVDLANYDRICAISFGKAAVAMARGLTSVLAPDFVVEGILVTPHAQSRRENRGVLSTSSSADLSTDVPGFRTIFAGHPIPDAGSMTAAREILRLLQSCDQRTILFFLLSGGGSALVELPLDSAVTLSDMQALHRLLVQCGAPIGDVNAVRKHLSAVKGGRLAAAAPASMKLTLAVSDVPPGRESALASGPTIPDPSTASDACEVIERYELLPLLPSVLQRKCARPVEIPETPKAGDPVFARSHFSLLLGMSDLFYYAQRTANAYECVAQCDNSTDDWPIPEAVDYLFDKLAFLAAENPSRRVCLIADGEVSSPVTGEGTGGRNSAFALGCVAKLAGQAIPGRKIAVLSAGTDGKDGSSPAAGAVADGLTMERARAYGLDPEEFARRSDSYTFFQKLGDTVETGSTGNNLRDLRLLIAE